VYVFDPLVYRKFCHELEERSQPENSTSKEEIAYRRSSPRDGVDILSKKILIFPLGDGKYHWSSAVMLNPGYVEVGHRLS
jgi:hypothetical protein